VATRMPSISGPSGYMLELLREGADFTLYRGRQHSNPSSVLAIALCAEPPSPQSLQRLEHEYSLAAELDPTWAGKPLVLTRHEGRTILSLANCYFAHDSSGFLALLLFCEVQSSRRSHPPLYVDRCLTEPAVIVGFEPLSD